MGTKVWVTMVMGIRVCLSSAFLIPSCVQGCPTSLRRAVCKDAHQPFPPYAPHSPSQQKGPRVQLHLYSNHHGCDSDAFVFAQALAKGYEHDERQSRGPYKFSRLAFARELMAKVTKAQGHNHLRFAMASFFPLFFEAS